jgi:hypothetical protein
MTSENPYPDEAPVLVKYPRTKAEEKTARESWPWLPGRIVQQCGPDEWQVCVEASEVAEEEEDGEITYPLCFRDSSEIRCAPRER